MVGLYKFLSFFMIAQNTKTIINAEDAMRENLWRYSPHFLKVHEFAESTYALYRKWKTEQVSLTPEQRNLIDWYKKWLEKFSYPKRADGKVIHPPLDKLQRIREIEKQPNHFLKVVIEMILNYVLIEELKKEIPDGSISLYGTSAYDDIFWWVDAIVWYDTMFAWRKMRSYLWIDYCVTQNNRYIHDKERKRKMSSLEEFNFMMWWKSENLISRITKAFDPYVISHLYTYVIVAITQWKKVDFAWLYNSIKKNSTNPVVQGALATSWIVNEILENNK